MSKFTKLSKSVWPYTTTTNVMVQVFRDPKTNLSSLDAENE